jgi:hypothetical protein
MQRNLLIKNQYGIISILLALAGIGVAVIALAADRLGFGGGTKIGANQFLLAIMGLMFFLSGVIQLVPATLRKFGVWLLLAIGAFSVALSADLFILLGDIPGLGDIADFRTKLVLLLSVAFGFFLIRAETWSQNGHSLLENLRNLLKIDTSVLGKFLGVVVQLGLLILVIRQFELGNVVFYDSIMQLVFYGFILHYFLPQEYRLPFFLFLSLVAFVGVLGITNGVWLIGTGLALIGLCHLPIKFGYRIILIALLVGLLAIARAGLIQTSLPVAIWPILGSVFMFRLIIYIYDLKHSKKPVNFWSALSYFFLLPNVVFPFFPVVDYSTYTRTYYNEDRHRIYQTGVEWILRGVIQLIFYRVVYYYVAISPEEIANPVELVRYTISNFMFYLRVSGEFHIIIGLLHLFGFNLPVANDHYLLSSSFTDLWRRVNIYWKDFMQKVFYYPSYVWLTKRKVSGTTALVLTTIIVFAVTWFLHAYQWFWLRGTFLIAAYDILFWSILTILVIRNTLAEAKQGRARTLGNRSLTFRDIAIRGFRNAATISLLFFLWTLWTSPSIGIWLSLWSIAANLQGILTLSIAFLIAVGVFIAVNWIYKDVISGTTGQPSKKPQNFFRTAFVNGAVILGIFLVGNPNLYNRVGGKTQEIIADLSTSRLNDADAKLLQRGYYEDLMGVNRFNAELWDIYSKRPTDWPLLQDTDAADYSDDPIRVVELNPSVSLVFHGAQLSTNQWRMRDKEYELIAAPGTYRIAIIGPSFVMGSGVADNEVFEWILEDRLNQDFGGVNYDRYEILNFGVAGYTALQELYQLENDVPAFEPKTIMWVGHHLEELNVVRYLANRYSLGIEMPYDYINEIAAQAGVKSGMAEEEIGKLLAPYGEDMVSWIYERVVEYAQEKGITPIWIYLPVFVGSNSNDIKATLIQQAEDAGFITFDLSGVYDGHDLDAITVAAWDRHPNGKGNELITDGLYQALLSNEETAAALGLNK